MARDRNRDDDDYGEEDRPPRKSKKFRAVEVLGAQTGIYRAAKASLNKGIVCFIIVIVGGLAFIVAAAAQAIKPPAPGVILGLVLAAVGIPGILICLSGLSLKVYLHVGGLHHLHRGRRRLIPWEDIVAVYQSIVKHYYNGTYTGTTYKYRLELEDGTFISYSSSWLNRVDDLGNKILEKTTALILPQAIRRYDKGKVVDFGKVGVSKKGLHYGSSLLKWKEITGVQLKAGYVSVRKRGKWLNWCNIAVSAIPNPFVFLALVNQIVGVDD